MFSDVDNLLPVDSWADQEHSTKCRADDMRLSCVGMQEATDIFGDVEDLLGQYEAAKADRASARDAELDDDLNPEDLDDAVAEAALRSDQVGLQRHAFHVL